MHILFETFHFLQVHELTIKPVGERWWMICFGLLFVEMVIFGRDEQGRQYQPNENSSKFSFSVIDWCNCIRFHVENKSTTQNPTIAFNQFECIFRSSRNLRLYKNVHFTSVGTCRLLLLIFMVTFPINWQFIFRAAFYYQFDIHRAIQYTTYSEKYRFAGK